MEGAGASHKKATHTMSAAAGAAGIHPAPLHHHLKQADPAHVEVSISNADPARTARLDDCSVAPALSTGPKALQQVDGPHHFDGLASSAATSPLSSVSSVSTSPSSASLASPTSVSSPLSIAHKDQLASRHHVQHLSHSPSDAPRSNPQQHDPAAPLPSLGLRESPDHLHTVTLASAASPSPSSSEQSGQASTPQPSQPSLPSPPPASAPLQPRISHPLTGHRRSFPSIEGIPRQTIIKALASVHRAHKPEALPLSGMLSTQLALGPGSAPIAMPSRPSTASSQTLQDALNDLAHQQQQHEHAIAGRGPPPHNLTPTTALLGPSLQSPCFYHERFDDAVDINRVLEEIMADEWMSHSRLVQTATGVREVSKQLQRRPLRRAVRNVMIVTKARDNQLVVLTRELARWLLQTPRYGSDLGINVHVDAKLRSSKRFDAPGLLAENPRFQSMLKYWTPDLCWSQPEKFDLVLTLGGDGTVLFTSWLFQRIVPPVLSFSLGSLGFLTTFEFDRYKEHLNRIMGDDGMRVNLRMRFTCTVYRSNADGSALEEAEQFEVLNELVIDRGPSPYVSNLELYGDNELLTVVQADGCIFSTPTGSTAYSLSAGGSLVHPDIPALLLTPICPHTLSFRPMVLSDTMLLRVSVPRHSRATAHCAFDGKGRVELKPGDAVTIAASQYPFPTVNRTDTEWFDSVSRTLRWNVRAATQKGFDIGSPSDDKDSSNGWDIDIDADSGCFPSLEGSISTSPLRRQMSLLGM